MHHQNFFFSFLSKLYIYSNFHKCITCRNDCMGLGVIIKKKIKDASENEIHKSLFCWNISLPPAWFRISHSGSAWGPVSDQSPLRRRRFNVGPELASISTSLAPSSVISLKFWNWYFKLTLPIASFLYRVYTGYTWEIYHYIILQVLQYQYFNYPT